MAIRAFISYSHKDADLLTQLHEHLSALQRQGLLDTWTDRKIHAGSVIEDHVEAQIEQAQLYLFLISSAFIQSDYCFEKEFARACERQQAGEAIIVPIIVRECDWKIPELRRFKALPEDGKPVVSRHWHNPDEAFANVAAGLRTLIERGPFSKAKRRKVDKATKKNSSVHVSSCPSFSLKTKRTTPQWADFRELSLNGERLKNVYCQISTASPYFRFGFKFLAGDGKLFGDGSIQSQDTNLVVHIGRNNHSEDVFLTTYKNGVREAFDKVLFKTKANFMVASVSVSIDNLNQLVLKVKGACCHECIVPGEICYRAVMLAWGDQCDYVVDVSNISLTSIR